MLRLVERSLVDSDALLLVCPVTASGESGQRQRGLVGQMRRRYKKAFAAYAERCRSGRVSVGQVLVFGEREPPIALAVTRRRQRDGIRMEDVALCLANLRDVVEVGEIASVAVPGELAGRRSWAQVWPELSQHITRAFAGLEVRVDVHAPQVVAGWPADAPTSAQLRAGRALAGLSVRDLAAAAGISPSSVTLLESGKTASPRPQTLDSIQSALEVHGVDFTADGWVRRRDDGRGVPEQPRVVERQARAVGQAVSLLERALQLLRRAA